MNDILYSLGSPLLGGVIGYFTNWLAIKMLFLPHEAKYIGKIKLPLTPGLIPKEKEKIAGKIANVLEDKILNKDTLKQNIFTYENEEKIYKFLNNQMIDFKQNDFTLDEILELIYKQDKNKKINRARSYILKNIKDIVYNKKNQDYICNIILEKIFEILDNKERNIYIKEILEKALLEIFKDNNIDKIKDKKISDFISEKNLSELKITIFENVPKLCNYISDELENNDNINQRLSELVKNVVEDNIGAFAGLFVNTDKIYISIRNSLLSYIRNIENQTIIGLKIFEKLSIYQNRSFLEIYNKIPEKTKEIIEDKIKEENIKFYIEKIVNNKDFQDIFDKNIEKFKIKLTNFLEKNIKDIISKKIYIMIKSYILDRQAYILNFKINNILQNIDLEKNKDKIIGYIDKAIDKQGDNFINVIDVKNIVEEKINSFDMNTIEEIILNVAKKELRAITFIGGVLGFIIGLIPVLLR